MTTDPTLRDDGAGESEPTRKGSGAKRIKRPPADLYASLKDQVRLLGNHIAALEAGDRAYLTEIANKLRLLLWDGERSNWPLLFEVAKFTPYTPALSFEGRQIKLQDWLNENAIYARLSETEAVHASRMDIIRAWTEQGGGTHEDPAHEVLMHFLKNDNMVYVGTMRAPERVLRAIAGNVHAVAVHLIGLIDADIARVTMETRDPK